MTTHRILVFEDCWRLQLGVSQLLQMANLELAGIFSKPEPFLAALRQQTPPLVLVSLGDSLQVAAQLLQKMRQTSSKARVLATFVRPTWGVRKLAERYDVTGLVDPLLLNRAGWLEAIEAVRDGKTFYRGVPSDKGSLAALESLQKLSTREREVLTYVATGADNLKISAILGITERTVKAHLSALYRKLALDNRTELALFAHQHGFNLPTALTG